MIKSRLGRFWDAIRDSDRTKWLAILVACIAAMLAFDLFAWGKEGMAAGIYTISSGIAGVIFGYLRHIQRITLPPGACISRISSFLFTRKTFESVLSPLLADFQFEYYEALKEGNRLRARYLRVLYTILFLKAAGLDTLLKLVGDVWTMVRGQAKK